MSKTYTHICNGTCSRSITIIYDPETKVIESVKFLGGCPGNTLGISKLVAGEKLDTVHDKLKGTLCGNKPTSCPNELALAIEEIENN